MDNIEYRHDIDIDMADYKKAYKLIDEASSLELCQQKTNGKTLLHVAAYYGCINYYKGNYKICELLISKMTPDAINLIDRNGSSALDIAIWHYNERAAIRLIPKMTITNLENAFEKAMSASFWQIEDILKMILSKNR